MTGLNKTKPWIKPRFCCFGGSVRLVLCFFASFTLHVLLFFMHIEYLAGTKLPPFSNDGHHEINIYFSAKKSAEVNNIEVDQPANKKTLQNTLKASQSKAILPEFEYHKYFSFVYFAGDSSYQKPLLESDIDFDINYGSMVVDVYINNLGYVDKIDIVSNTTANSVDSVVEVIKQARFSPGIFNDNPIFSKMRLSINFDQKNKIDDTNKIFSNRIINSVNFDKN